MPWFRWLVVSFALIFSVLLAVHLLRGHAWQFAVRESLIWGGISAWVFVVAKIRAVRRGRQCALCEKVPGLEG